MAVDLPSRGFRSWRTHIAGAKAGHLHMGPVRVANTDAFGLFRRERLYCGTDTLVVYPRTFDVPEFAIHAAYLSGESSARKLTYDLTPHASSVREYASGDSISRVHWNSTARLGKLMSKEFDLGRSSDVWLFVDLHRDVQAGSWRKARMNTRSLSPPLLAGKYLRSNLPVGLIGYGDQRYFLPADTGSGQYDRVMESLAMSKAEGVTPLEAALPMEERLWGVHSSLVVITPSHRPEWVLALEGADQTTHKSGGYPPGGKLLWGNPRYPERGT